MRIFRRLVPLFLLAVPAASATPGCGPPARLCAAQEAVGGPEGPLLSEYLCAINPGYTPHPLGYNSEPATEWARVQANGLIGLCGQFVCATDLKAATTACREAAGSSPAALLAESLPTFVMYAGQTLPEQLSLNPSLNLAWNAAGQVCYDGLEAVQPPAPDAGTETCPDACDDGQGGTLQNVGEHCGGISMCCAGLTCVGAGDTYMGVCQGTLAQCPTQPALPPLPLTTTRLRFIANAQGFGMGQSGVTLSRTYGLAFQTWVLFMLNQTENKMLYPSQLRKMANNNGLPAGVIPDYVADLKLFVLGGGKVTSPFAMSQFGEVKAVTGNLTYSSNYSQILGLIDVTSQSPAGMSPVPNHMPPALVFTTTGNTTLDPNVAAKGTQYSVAVWQQLVWEAPAFLNDPNPDLFLGDTNCLNPMIYGVPMAQQQASGARSKLTAPTVQLTPIPGDPDPPEVD